MSNVTKLAVYRDVQPVAVITNLNGVYTLHYHKDVTLPVSLSLPITPSRTVSGDVVENWLENLLPESTTVRYEIRRNNGLDRKSVTALDYLAAVGEDVSGAYIFTNGASVTPFKHYHSLTTRQIEFEVKKIKSGWSPDLKVVGKRMSVAGYQKKFALTKSYKGWTTSTSVSPSTHIFKPSVDLYGDELEIACLDLARSIGIPAAEATILYGSFVTTRFDRMQTPNGVQRIPVEDMVQALGLPPESKDEVTPRQILDILSKYGTPGSVESFLKQLIFNTHVGNSDAHGKNYSIFLNSDGTVTPTPIYDVLPMGAWPTYDQNLVMPINGQSDASKITQKDWYHFAVEHGLPTHEVVAMVNSVVLWMLRNASHALLRYVQHATSGIYQV